MLFVQGTRDSLVELRLLEPVVAGLGPSASLHPVEGADHSFHVLARSGRNDREVMREVLDAFAAWATAESPAEAGTGTGYTGNTIA
jgi:hypothetical protein